MRIAFTRIIGIVLVISAVTAMLFSVYGLVQIWQAQTTISDQVVYNISLVQSALTTTNHVLTLTNQTLDTVAGNVGSMKTTTDAMATSLDDMRPMMNTLNRLVGQDIPQTITSTQTSLQSAESSALLIDNMLSTLSKIPFLGLGQYSPQVPLHVALQNVASSLNDLKPTLQTIQKNLNTSDQDLATMESQMLQVSSELESMNQNLSQAKDLVDQYQGVNQQLMRQFARLQLMAPSWIQRLVWLLTLIIIWLIVTQVGLFLQGLELLGIIHPGTLRRKRDHIE